MMQPSRNVVMCNQYNSSDYWTTVERMTRELGRPRAKRAGTAKWLVRLARNLIGENSGGFGWSAKSGEKMVGEIDR